MYKVTATASGYNSIEFVFENMTEASAFMATAFKNVVSEGFTCHVEEFVPVSDLKQE